MPKNKNKSDGEGSNNGNIEKSDASPMITDSEHNLMKRRDFCSIPDLNLRIHTDLNHSEKISN